MANKAAAWIALIGGIVAVIAQFSPNWYGALIGGVIAVIGGIMAMMK